MTSFVQGFWCGFVSVLLMCIGLALFAFAQVTFVHARGHDGFTRAGAKKLVADIEARFDTFGMPLGPTKLISVHNPFRRYQNLSQRQPLAFHWRAWFARRHIRSAGMAIVPALDGYMAGFSFRGCRGKGYAAVHPKNDLGQDRYEHSIIAIMHELGRARFGLRTDDSEPNIMMSAPLPLVGVEELLFLKGGGCR
jgi:hypothetical protein